MAFLCFYRHKIITTKIFYDGKRSFKNEKLSTNKTTVFSSRNLEEAGERYADYKVYVQCKAVYSMTEKITSLASYCIFICAVVQINASAFVIFPVIL